MQILFAHGLESGPQGRKTAWLHAAGHVVEAPDCRGLDLDARIDVLCAALRRRATPPILVGSSFGGIAGVVAAIFAARERCGPRALLLCAPALQVPVPPRWQTELAPPCPTVVVHGTRDEVIPFEVSRAWAQRHGVPLVACDDDHSLAGSRDVILAALDQLSP